ncbi:MAG: DUF2726 domain-containing protein [Patescibacteria group bacterium]
MNTLLIIGGVVLILFVGVGIFSLFQKREEEEPDLSVYERKPFLFDTVSEFNLYKVLLELFGDKYHIFPQVNYSHLIQPRKSTWEEERRHRSRIDRKSADFVFCDKDRVVPQLIIELDGSVHNFKSKQARDEFINELTKLVDLPILHLKTGSIDKEFIRAEINKKLNRG